MEQIKLISSYTTLSFPHYTKLIAAKTDIRTVNLKDYHGFNGQDKLVNIPAIVSGEVFLVEDPRRPVMPGDVVFWNNDHSYRVVDIIEERLARGDWSFVKNDFTPQFKRITISRK